MLGKQSITTGGPIGATLSSSSYHSNGRITNIAPGTCPNTFQTTNNNQIVKTTNTSCIDEKSLTEITHTLSKCISNTKMLNEFSQVLQLESINSPNISGHTDFYYPDLSNQSSQFPNELPEISKIRCVPIPNELMEQYTQIQHSFNMGLFTCISRAWLSIDNLIFFWNYEDGSDICFYDNLDDTILTAELFRPKSGTFDDGVEYGLCLATNSVIVLLSIDFIRYTKGNGAIVDEMRFSPQPLYSISTENMIVNTIKSSKTTGRIFMGSKDGCLYEFFYQNQAGWFSSQTKRINLSQSKLDFLVPSFLNFNDADSIVQIEIDESRNVLYTRSQNSTIQIFYLGATGMESSKLNYITGNSIANKAASLISSNDRHFFQPIVKIFPFSINESRNISLMAITHYGIRLYFSLNSFENTQTDVYLTPQAPSTFQLVHVRLPPNIELSSSQRPSIGPVNSAFYNNGISLMMSPKDDHTDSVLLMNRDLFLLHNHLKESKSIFDIDGRIQIVDEIIPSLKNIKSLARENEMLETIRSASGTENVPKLTSEFFDPPRKFVMVTQQGCYIWSKLRPIDQFSWALMENCGPNSENVKLFFSRIYEKGEACALSLAVSLMFSNEANGRVSEWATQAFFIYSGEAEIRKNSNPKFLSTNVNTFSSYPNSYHMTQQQHQQQQQQQQELHAYNPQNTMMLGASDSGMVDMHADNTIYGDMTMLNTNHKQSFGTGTQFQQYGMNTGQTRAHQPISYLTSPQKMSTPINMRTKDQFFSTASNQQQKQQQPFFNLRQSNPITQVASQVQPPAITGQIDGTNNFTQQNECEIAFSGKHDAIYIYLSRLLAPIWDQKLLNELHSLNGSQIADIDTSSQSMNSTSNNIDSLGYSSQIFASFSEINVQWYLNRLNELKRFMDVNFPQLKNIQHSSILGGSAVLNVGDIDNTTNILASPVTLFQYISSMASTNMTQPSPSTISPSATITTSSSSSELSSISTSNVTSLASTQRNTIQMQSCKLGSRFSSLSISTSLLANLTNSLSIGKSVQAVEQKLATEIENGSLFLLKQYVNRIVEIFGLWKILDEHKFHFVSSKLEKQTLSVLLNMNVKTFLLADNSLLEQLINALLYRYIDDNASTDLLNLNLKQFCPSLHTNENAIFSKACERLKQALNVKNDSYEKNRLIRDAVDLMKQIGYVANIAQICNMLYSAGCYEQIFELCLSAAEKIDPQNIALYFYHKGEPLEDVEGLQYFNHRTECYKHMLDCLTSLLKTIRTYPNHQQQQQQRPSMSAPGLLLNKEMLEEQVNMLIRYVISSQDELAHVCIFNWMVTFELDNKLISLESPYLELFLKHQIKEQQNNRQYYDLLWRFYDFKKDYTNAAKILIRLAEKYSESHITLKERVNYLTQAIVALNSSPNAAAVKDEQNELNDRKDVALIQEKIYEELMRLSNSQNCNDQAVNEALHQLDSQLYDITKLFYEFADKFDLYQCQLSIFKMSRHEDNKTIGVLWKQIIANELDKVNTEFNDKPNDIKSQLAENILTIAKDYIDEEDKYFPLDTMIDSLEFVSLSRGFEPEWACTLLRKLNIPFYKLLKTYNDSYDKKDIKWTDNLSRFIHAIYSLIELFSRAPNATKESDKRKFSQFARDLIPKYINELTRINDDLSNELIGRFNSISYIIERM